MLSNHENRSFYIDQAAEEMSARYPPGARRTDWRTDMKKEQFWVYTTIAMLLLVSALYVIVFGDYDETIVNWAMVTIGVVSGSMASAFMR